MMIRDQRHVARSYALRIAYRPLPSAMRHFAMKNLASASSMEVCSSLQHHGRTAFSLS